MSNLPVPPGIPPGSGKMPDSPWLAIAAILAGVAALEVAKNIRNRYYKNETIHLDGYNFWNCGFHNCTLVTDTATFSLHSCTLMNVTIQFGPNLIRAIRMWNIFNPNSRWPYFNPRIELDGSITIE